MKRFLQEIPFPVSGVILSIVSLGNLLQDLTRYIHILCGIVATICFLILTMKIIVCWQEQVEGLKDPVVASTYATYSMTIMMLSVYLQPILGLDISFVMWIVGIALHLVFIIYFTYQFVLIHLEWHKLFASYFVGYAGIACIAITAPEYHIRKMGQVAFWVGFLTVSAMMALVTYRNIKFPKKEPHERPLFCVYASPWNVCLIGYLHSFATVDVELIMGIYVVATILYVVALTNVKQSVSRTFYPSYASYTFPFVVAASGTKQIIHKLSSMGYTNILHLHIWMIIQIVIAVALVSYASSRYVLHIREQITANNV